MSLNSFFQKTTKYLVAFVVALFSPFFILTGKAQFLPTTDHLCPEGASCPDVAPDKGGVVGFLVDVANWITFVSVGLAVLFLVIGGVFYITDTGDGQNAEKGKSIIKNAFIGLLITILAYTIVSFVAGIFAGGFNF